VIVFISLLSFFFGIYVSVSSYIIYTKTLYVLAFPVFIVLLVWLVTIYKMGKKLELTLKKDTNPK
jgi:hypothetical protein